jgi:hypothetical protein
MFCSSEVDAYSGEQTRRHGDLDIVVESRDAPKVATALRDRGYVDVPRDDTSTWNFVLGDDEGHEVDFHVIVLVPSAMASMDRPRRMYTSPPRR